MRTPLCTCMRYWPLILNWLLPPVAALLSSTALWVASRARSTSAAALSTSQVVARSAMQRRAPHERRGSLRGAPDRRRS